MGSSTWSWLLPDGTASHDWEAWCRRLYAVAALRALEVHRLGRIDGDPLLVIRPTASGIDRPRRLIASGFHGEEPAGPWGVLAFLETVSDAALAACELTLLPLVNVSGFRAGRRLNDHGENPNRGFLPGEEQPSMEGRLLLQHESSLVEASRDGLLSCHEDVLLSHCYLYANERSEQPGHWARQLLAVNADYFPVHPDGEVDGCPVRSGIVFNQADTSFESWLFQRGASRAACVETPGQADFMQRVAAQAAMMQRFLMG
ncbi:MAG: M14 family metallopeptidase [Steroidobacteraceae bacterium]